jgi:hypothetical protein
MQALRLMAGAARSMTISMLRSRLLRKFAPFAREIGCRCIGLRIGRKILSGGNANDKACCG